MKLHICDRTDPLELPYEIMCQKPLDYSMVKIACFCVQFS